MAMCPLIFAAYKRARPISISVSNVWGRLIEPNVNRVGLHVHSYYMQQLVIRPEVGLPAVGGGFHVSGYDNGVYYFSWEEWGETIQQAWYGAHDFVGSLDYMFFEHVVPAEVMAYIQRNARKLLES